MKQPKMIISVPKVVSKPKRGGKKLKRCSRPSPSRRNQASRTARNKYLQAAKRKARKQYWIERGTKKNGAPVRAPDVRVE